MTPFMHHRVDMTPSGEGICNCGEITPWIDEHVAVWASRDEELTRRVTIAADELEPGDLVLRYCLSDNDIYVAEPPVQVNKRYYVRDFPHMVYVDVDGGTFQSRKTARVNIITTRQIEGQ